MKYDAIIIGAGMSGLAAGIRLAMFDKKVVIVEAHSIAGGLNSYYKRARRDFDVGLHALTNFAPKGERQAPLTKLLKQLRLPYEELKLCEQSHSKILFPEHELNFTNEFDFFVNEVREKFPTQIDGFLNLVAKVRSFNDVALDNDYLPAREVVKNFISDPDLLEMIFCPLLIYGSAWEDDMDFSQFVIMFKALYLEGLSRPQGGVRTIINLLLKRYQELGGELRFRSRVVNIQSHNETVTGVELASGEILESARVLSSMGHPETMKMTGVPDNKLARTGALSFCESIFICSKKPAELGQSSTLIFYNERPEYRYRCPQEAFDPLSAVVCLPNNYQNDELPDGWVRATFIANHDHFKAALTESKEKYQQMKEQVSVSAKRIMNRLIPTMSEHIIYEDIFSPTTVTKYTSHFGGAVYGSPDKLRDGKTPLKGLALCGTDQGFLGIVGSMLSGISMANFHVLMES